MTEQQKKAALEHLAILYQLVDHFSDDRHIGTIKYKRAIESFYSACEMLQVLYGEEVADELRRAAVLAV